VYINISVFITVTTKREKLKRVPEIIQSREKVASSPLVWLRGGRVNAKQRHYILVTIGEAGQRHSVKTL
jgi:hypothetical protein